MAGVAHDAHRISYAWMVALLVPLAVAIGLYSPVADAGFAFDDRFAITGNPLIDGHAAWSEAFTRNFWGDRPGFEHLASWRPLTVLSLRPQYAGGEGATAMHVGNLALHLMVVLSLSLTLVFANRERWWVAGAVGLAAAGHPVFSEAVASVVGRGDLLAGLLGLWALTLWQRRVGWALVVFALALSSKETALMMVAGALAQALWRRRWGPAGALAGLTIVWFVLRHLAVGGAEVGIDPLDNPLAEGGSGTRLVGGLGVVGRYASWMLTPQPIAADYAATVDLASGGYPFIGALALLGLGLVSWRALRDGWGGQLGPAGWLAGLAGLLLLSNLLVLLPTPVAGRLAYVPALAVLLGLGATLATAKSVRGAAIGAGVVAFLGAVGALTTVDQVAAWQNERALFEHSVAIEPASVKARVNLARELRRAGESEAAEAHLRAVLEAVPNHPSAQINLALVADEAGRGDEAWALALAGAEAERRPGRGASNVCAFGVTRPGVDLDLVQRHCLSAIAGLPNVVEPRVNLARLLARRGAKEDAEARFRDVLAARPDDPFALGHFIGFLAQSRRFEEAVPLQERVLAARSDDPEARRNLVALLVQAGGQARHRGDVELACAHARRALELAPAVPQVRAAAARLCPGS